LPEPSRSRYAQCDPSTRCRAGVRRSPIGVEPWCSFTVLARRGDVEVAIRAVRNHGLTRLETELDAIELYRDDIRLERHQIGDAITVTDHEATGCLADIDAVVAVGSVAQDPFVFFIEGVHGGPGERDPSVQFARVGRQVDVLPCASRRALLLRPDGVPGRDSK